MSRKSVLVAGNSSAIQRMFREEGWGVIEQNNFKDKPDLICLPGGMDISPALYGQKALAKTRFDIFTDKKEIEVIRRFKDVPKAGICRGGQLLNVLSGGSMWQHVENHASSHEIKDLLLTKKDFIVSSTHHQMMIPGHNAVVLAVASPSISKNYYSADPKAKRPQHEPEVIWYEDTNALCFQPHPEINHKSNEHCRNYFFALLNFFF